MNERWYSLTVEDIEKKLNTNVSLGLDKKEAERRRRRSGSASLYRQISESPFVHVGKLASDITFIIFVLATLISVFFDKGKTSGTCLVIALFAFTASIIIYLLSKNSFERAAELSLPRVKVLRDGKPRLIDSSDVVVGDIILLEKGDIVPADCRLVSCFDMRAIEFVGRIAGKEKKELTVKDASVIYRNDEKLGIAAQQNMISASSVISSGDGIAIAVKTGKNTFVSSMLGELEAFPVAKREMRVMGSLSRLFSRCSLAVLIATVPITAIAMIIGRNNYGILDVFLLMLALSVTVGGELIFGMSYIFPAAAVRRWGRAKGSAVIKFPSSIEEMNYVDSVMILGSKSVCCDEKYVESVFAANRFYDALTAKDEADDALNCLMDIALLGTSRRLAEKEFSKKTSNFNAKAISDFASFLEIDREKLMNLYELVEFSSSDVSGFDTSLVKNGEEYRVICVSEDSSLISLCTHIRTPEGALALDNDKKSDILRACSQLSKKAKSVTLVASRISPCSSLSRLGALQNQLIFEGYIVYSEPYIDTCAARINEMHEADIDVYFIAEENAESVITAFNIGAVKGKHEIAYASAFRRNGKSISENFGQYRAYLGFNMREIEELSKLIKGDDGTLAVIASETEHLSLMNGANVSAVLSDFDGNERRHPEIISKNADVLLPGALRSGGGFEAFCAAVLASKSASGGLCRFIRYLSFSASLRLTLSVIPLFFGRMLLSAVQIMFAGMLVDIFALLVMAFARNTLTFSDKIEDVETLFTSPFKICAKYLVSGAVLGLVVLMLSVVFGSANIVSASLMNVFSFVGTVLSELFAIFIIARIKEEDKTASKFFGTFAVAVIAIIILSLAVPSFGALLGVTYPGWQVCAAAPLVSVIGYVMLLVTDRYI
ncbi:MAG: cation-transporting P-type ATPase [Ruminococcaceae bacterium]|nr:cation-transporting P-type ATPase [Oscillospiraceae bacterium]